jgi:hypothetical protein
MMPSRPVGQRIEGGRLEARFAKADHPRRPYRTPALQALGDVRDVTLGGSPGMGDTQNPMTEGNIPFYGEYIIMP